MTAPLSATQFAQTTHWSSHYLVSLSLSVLNAVILATVFKFQAQDGMSIDQQFFLPSACWHGLSIPTECLRQAGEVAPSKTQEIYENKFSQLIYNKAVHLIALFVTVYIGVEVTITGMFFFIYAIAQLGLLYISSGWIVTYLMIVRDGGPSSGYILTGFYCGKYPTYSYFFVFLFLSILFN